ncbi:MAG: CoA transferase subunit A [Chloroflexi bacterium]|nr:CoA transferase subunit A [Chloroflexota bacterium]
MEILAEGSGELVGWHDPDEHREWVRQNKSRNLLDKRMSIAEAVAKYVFDGAFIAFGGFGHIRVSMAAVYEIIRQRKKHLILAGKTAVHDADILIGSGCVDRIEVAYAFGHELRGLSPASRRAVETGQCKVVAELSNAAYQWRFLAAMMGVPFIPTRNMLGTDTFKYSSAKVAKDPFSGKPICLLPACYPDVVFIHVPRCDMYGNAQIDGTIIEDFELARAARRLILTTEEIVPESEIRSKPWRTVIPFFLVDAVVEVPYGAHPCQMPLRYFFDEEHIGEWLQLSRSPEGTKEYFDKYVYGTKDFNEYLELVGGLRKLQYLKQVEELRAPMRAPWLKKKEE